MAAPTTDHLLKQAGAADSARTSDLFDLWRFGMIDRAGLEDGCREIISNAAFYQAGPKGGPAGNYNCSHDSE